MSILRREGFPKEGELVIATVKRVERHGAIVSLDEYDGLEAFVHVSEISLKWVRNITDYLRVGQRTVLKVIRSNPDTLQVDVSLRRVSNKEHDEKMWEWSRKVKAARLIEAVAKETGTPMHLIEEHLVQPVRSRGLNFYSFLEELAMGEALPSWVKLPEAFTAKLIEKCVRDLKRPGHVAKAIVKMSSRKGGVEAIRRAAETCAAIDPSSVKVTIVGSPRYLVRVEGRDLQDAESKLKACIERMRAVLSNEGDVVEVLPAGKEVQERG
ncbi:MAG: S1 RNA-binding domain-containing protein [Thaumarchaeota archaeon]|nr:S1 RNA-binding domain-containing protein [Candidatus Calditenuaceae archaeon]MDW8041447.1 S1 RNA-binding domain-containing protein [Nitrososphaerota archaeon]